MMKILLQILLILFYLSTNAQVDCSKYNSKKYIPYNLSDALSFLTCKWDDSSKEAFKSKPENDAIAEAHHGIGTGLRNSWKLWKGKSKLAKFFNEKGIYHPDDMSSIILTSFHRHLNEEELLLDDQVLYYTEYWAKINNEEYLRVNNEFQEYSIGDTVTFNYPFDFISKEQEEHFMNDTCYPVGIVRNVNIAEYTLQIGLLTSCDINGIITFHGNVYIDEDGKQILEKKDVREIMKNGEEKWTHYSYWDPE